MDFGSSGKGFYHTWWPHNGDRFNTPEFKEALQQFVDAVWEDNQLGLCVRLTHEDGYQSVYAGLSNADYVRAGDPVAQGQTIGHAGNGVLAESDAEPHLHLEIWKDGRPVDPIAVFLGVDNKDTI